MQLGPGRRLLRRELLRQLLRQGPHQLVPPGGRRVRPEDRRPHQPVEELPPLLGVEPQRRPEPAEVAQRLVRIGACPGLLQDLPHPRQLPDLHRQRVQLPVDRRRRRDGAAQHAADVLDAEAGRAQRADQLELPDLGRAVAPVARLGHLRRRQQPDIGVIPDRLDRHLRQLRHLADGIARSSHAPLPRSVSHPLDSPATGDCRVWHVGLVPGAGKWERGNDGAAGMSGL